jgi:hypothetical protein
MKQFIFTIAILFTLFSCTDEKGARKALLDAGYHPISVGGYAFWGCGEGDTFHSMK